MDSTACANAIGIKSLIPHACKRVAPLHCNVARGLRYLLRGPDAPAQRCPGTTVAARTTIR
ncbi:MAG: hypothetical protein C0521_13760 [Xanthomonas sp.]|nr:hypothetical protein [Xanthomonas sp.]